MAKQRFEQTKIKVVSEQKEAVVEETVFSSNLPIVKVEDDCVIVLLEGWRMRIYFTEKADRTQYRAGQSCDFKHFGEISNPHEVQFLPIQ